VMPRQPTTENRQHPPQITRNQQPATVVTNV
jgi:hypothetical protein